MKRLLVLLAPAAVIAGITVGSAFAWGSGTAVAPATKATFLMAGGTKACSDWGGYDVFHVGANASSVRRGLVQFDLSSLPPHAQITSATLSVYETITLRGSGTVGVHRVTTAWAEGAGSNTCTGGANWTGNGLGGSWLTPGGDYTAPDAATVSKTAGNTPGWDRFDITSIARGWANNTYPNDGILLKLDNESSSPCTTLTNCNYWAYASNEYSDPTLRPTLTITYH